MGTGGRPGRTKARELRVAEPPDTVSRAARLLPILGWLPAYRRGCLVPDFLPGLPVWAGLGPVAMAHSGLVGGPPLMGLFTIVPPLVGYAALGPSARARRRAGHRNRADIRADGGRHRDAGNGELRHAHVHPRNPDRGALPARWRAPHGLGGRLHSDAGDAGF